jgi:hypothetical protein
MSVSTTFDAPPASWYRAAQADGQSSPKRSEQAPEHAETSQARVPSWPISRVFNRPPRSAPLFGASRCWGQLASEHESGPSERET